MRTTIDIDGPVLVELKRLQQLEGKSLGRLASDLLAKALADQRQPRRKARARWHSQPMGLKIDILDKEALYEILDRDGR